MKYTYLSAFCSPFGMDFPRTLFVQYWTGENGSSQDAPSVLQIQFLCDKTREISEIINFHCTFTLHSFHGWFLCIIIFHQSWWILIYRRRHRGTNSHLFNFSYFKANVFRFIRTFFCKMKLKINTRSAL